MKTFVALGTKIVEQNPAVKAEIRQAEDAGRRQAAEVKTQASASTSSTIPMVVVICAQSIR